jgi:serine/threonine protein kinase
VTIPAGKKLGRYEIRSKLGAGVMGEVYLAQDTSELACRSSFWKVFDDCSVLKPAA